MLHEQRYCIPGDERIRADLHLRLRTKHLSTKSRHCIARAPDCVKITHIECFLNVSDSNQGDIDSLVTWDGLWDGMKIFPYF